MVLMLSLAVGQVLGGGEGTLCRVARWWEGPCHFPATACWTGKLPLSWNARWGHKAGEWAIPRLCDHVSALWKIFTLWGERFCLCAHHGIPCSLVTSFPSSSLLAVSANHGSILTLGQPYSLCPWSASTSPYFPTQVSRDVDQSDTAHFLPPGHIMGEPVGWLLWVRCQPRSNQCELQEQVTGYHPGHLDRRAMIMVFPYETGGWVSEAGTGLIYPVQVSREKERSKEHILFLWASPVHTQCFIYVPWMNRWMNKHMRE